MLLFQLAIILFASKVAGHLSTKLGQPSVLGKLLVGIILGPAVLNFIHETSIIATLSQIGVILLMFLAGLETDIQQFKASAKASSYTGFLGIIIPFAGGFLAGEIIHLPMVESIFLGLLLSATSVSISVQALKELNVLKTKEGATILGAAVIDDVVVMILLAVTMSFVGSDVSIGIVLMKKVAYFIIAILVAWKGIPLFLQQFAKLRVTQPVITASLIVCFVFAFTAEYAGVADIIGAYIAGVAISATKFQHAIYEKVETVGYTFFVPIFFTSVGLHLELSSLSGNIWLIVILSVIAILTKLFGAGVGARFAGFSWNSALGVGAAMVSRGEVALIIAGMGVEAGFLDKEMYAVIVMVVLITTIVTPILMKQFFKNEKQIEDLTHS